MWGFSGLRRGHVRQPGSPAAWRHHAHTGFGSGDSGITDSQRPCSATISSVLGEQLAPLASEVNRRWQTVIPDRPNLKLMPDGTMSRDAGGFPLAFTAFSAGEKMVARLMMRLTTLLVSTKVPFCWVDEPLEHLDPRSRHLVGSMLAHLSTAPGLERIFVTTHEELLARRLAELQPGRVRVEYLRAEHVG